MTRRRAVCSLVVGVCLAAALPPPVAVRAQSAAQIPANPRDLKYPTLTYTPPDRAKYRRVLANGVVAYMVEDHDLPLTSVSVLFRGGSYVEPKGKEGLASAVGGQMRAGGAGQRTAEQFDEDLDFLAANLSSGIGPTTGTGAVNFLAKDADQALGLLFDMLRRPAFQADRLELFKSQQLQGMERRNDATDRIEGREWARLIRGASHFTTAPTTKASVESITRDDLIAFHRAWVHPGNMILAVSGDFKTADMVAKLDKAMAGWTFPKMPVTAPGAQPIVQASPPASTPAQPTVAPGVPKPMFAPKPGVYMVNKPEVNQGRVTIGHLGIVRGNPDEIAVDMMNDILGGASFSSRITNRVRSDEGLAYSAGSSFTAGTYYEGVFAASFQSKSATVAQATQIILDEINRMRNEKPTAEELDTLKNNAVEIFPRYFATAGAIASTFATDELTGRDPAFWSTYRDRVRALTAEDIQRVAQKYLHPDQLVILAVGAVDDMLKGNPDKPQFSFDKIAGGKPIVRIPLPDPLTMTYPSTPK